MSSMLPLSIIWKRAYMHPESLAKGQKYVLYEELQRITKSKMRCDTKHDGTALNQLVFKNKTERVTS